MLGSRQKFTKLEHAWLLNLADQFVCSVCDLLKSPAVTKICNAEELKSEFLVMLVAVIYIYVLPT